MRRRLSDEGGFVLLAGTVAFIAATSGPSWLRVVVTGASAAVAMVALAWSMLHETGDRR